MDTAPHAPLDVRGVHASESPQNVGNSGAYNPGNAQDPAPPFVPFVIGCNPTAP
jgi:hypothetical protein